MVDDFLRFRKFLVVDFVVENVAQINWCLESYISGPSVPLSFSMGPIPHQTLHTRAYMSTPHVIVAVVRLRRGLIYVELGPIPIGGKLFIKQSSFRDSQD